MEYDKFLETDFEEDVYKFTVKVTAVDYDVSEEDFWDIGDPEEVDAMIRKTKNGLPQRLTLEIECIDDEGALEDKIGDAISEETGWIANGFDYRIAKKELID